MPPVLYSRFVADNLRARLLRQAQFTRTVRSFFQERGYLEVDTPTLSPFLIPEPSIEVFQTSFHSRGGGERPLWLIPSPELWMKRLLAAGSGQHLPDQPQLPKRGLRRTPPQPGVPSPRVLHGERRIPGFDSRHRGPVFPPSAGPAAGPRTGPPDPPFTRLTMEGAFRRHAGIELAGCVDARSMREAGIRAGARDAGGSHLGGGFPHCLPHAGGALPAAGAAAGADGLTRRLCRPRRVACRGRPGASAGSCTWMASRSPTAIRKRPIPGR